MRCMQDASANRRRTLWKLHLIGWHHCGKCVDVAVVTWMPLVRKLDCPRNDKDSVDQGMTLQRSFINCYNPQRFECQISIYRLNLQEFSITPFQFLLSIVVSWGGVEKFVKFEHQIPYRVLFRGWGIGWRNIYMYTQLTFLLLGAQLVQERLYPLASCCLSPPQRKNLRNQRSNMSSRHLKRTQPMGKNGKLLSIKLSQEKRMVIVSTRHGSAESPETLSSFFFMAIPVDCNFQELRTAQFNADGNCAVRERFSRAFERLMHHVGQDCGQIILSPEKRHHLNFDSGDSDAYFYQTEHQELFSKSPMVPSSLNRVGLRCCGQGKEKRHVAGIV